MRQQAAWWISVAAAVILGLAFLWVARSATKAADYAPIQAGANRARQLLFAAGLVVLALVSAVTLSRLPYPPAEGPGSAQIVTVTGLQWAWQLSTSEVAAGRTVEFQVTSGDVNHGFGIYDEQMRLLAQVQAMPGYTNRLRYRFIRPGHYTILCLEYCGMVHHFMKTDLTVTGDAVALAGGAQ